MKIKKLNLNTLANICTYHLPALFKIKLKSLNRFFFYNIRVAPIIASLNITERCNFNCQMCGVWRKDSREELTTAEWKEAFRQLKDEGVRCLYFIGGEPLLREDLTELTAYAHSLGFRVSIATNGYLLREDLVLRIAENGPASFVVSLDALESDFERIRGKSGVFPKVKAACQMLSRLAKARPGLEVFICATIMKDSLPHIIEVVKFAGSLEIPVFFSLLDQTPYFFRDSPNEALRIAPRQHDELKRVVDELIRIKKQDPRSIRQSFTSLRFITDYFKDSRQKNLPCHKCLIRIFLGPQGKVFPGCWSLGHIGTLKDSGLREIMRSPAYRIAQRKMFLKECPGCSCGYMSDFKYHLGHLFNEMKYNFL